MTQRVNKSSIVGKNEKSKSSWNISYSLRSFLSCDGGDGMRELNKAIAFAKGKKVMTTLVVKNANLKTCLSIVESMERKLPI